MTSPRRLLPAVILLLGLAPVRPDLAMRASPIFGKGPTDVRVVVRTARNTDNRLLRIAIDSESYFRSSDITLAGAAASEEHLVSWRGVPQGLYVVTATLYGARGVRLVTTTGIDLRFE